MLGIMLFERRAERKKKGKKENTLSPVSTVIISVIRLSLLNISARQEIAGNLSKIIGRQNFNSAQRARKHQILIFLFAALKGSFTVLCLHASLSLSPLPLSPSKTEQHRSPCMK